MTPPGKTDSPPIESRHSSNPRLLRIYIGYRLLLSVLFITLIQFQLFSNYLSSANHRLLSLIMGFYLLINLFILIVFYRRRGQPSETAQFAVLSL